MKMSIIIIIILTILNHNIWALRFLLGIYLAMLLVRFNIIIDVLQILIFKRVANNLFWGQTASAGEFINGELFIF